MGTAVRFTSDVFKQHASAQVLVEVQETILGSESLLTEDVEVEAHLNDCEPFGDGSPQFAEQGAVHEVKVVDWVTEGVRRRCS